MHNRLLIINQPMLSSMVDFLKEKPGSGRFINWYCVATEYNTNSLLITKECYGTITDCKMEYKVRHHSRKVLV